MSSLWMRKTTWAAVALGAFGAGAALWKVTPLSKRPPVEADPDVVSRATDSESEVSASLAAQPDGALAVAWIADGGGRDGSGRYVGVRVSDASGNLGPLERVETRGASVSHDSIVALPGGDFALVWQAGDSVYAARISRSGAVGEHVEIAPSATQPRATTTPNGTVLVSFALVEQGKRKLAVAWSHDGKTYTFRYVADAPPEDAMADVCGDDKVAIVTEVDPGRGVRVHRTEFETQAPADTSTVSTIAEHVARDRAACFVSADEAFVVYGVTEHPQNEMESRVAESLEFVRSRDGGRNFQTRAVHRTPSHLILPTMIHHESTFTLLAVMGSGAGDAHASASVIVLGADGRTQNGLTRTVVAPMTMVVSPDEAGWMGDSLGLAETKGVTWAAVPENGGGSESHVTLVRVL